MPVKLSEAIYNQIVEVYFKIWSYFPLCVLKFITITYSVLISPCFAWHPYGKLGLIKAE